MKTAAKRPKRARSIAKEKQKVEKKDVFSNDCFLKKIYHMKHIGDSWDHEPFGYDLLDCLNEQTSCHKNHICIQLALNRWLL